MNTKRKYSFNINKIIDDSDDKYYWLGFISGDGVIRKKENRLRIELSEKDKDHLQNFLDFFESNAPIYERINNHGNKCCKVDINSAELRRYLERYNIVENKTPIFVIPIDLIPEQYIWHYIRGYMDADGCISYRGEERHYSPMLSFVSARQENLEILKQVFNIENKVSFINNNYFLIKEGNQVIDILNNIYQNSTIYNRLKRKYDIYCSVLKQFNT